MKKKGIAIGVTVVMVLVGAALAFQPDDSQLVTQKSEVLLEPDVVMPNKSSRPGCEETDTCYIPSVITIKQGEKVVWSNDDVAFHSITSGLYDSPTDLFDSGHLDPQQQFTVRFDEKGTFDYFCTLHPWMAGQVVVE